MLELMLRYIIVLTAVVLVAILLVNAVVLGVALLIRALELTVWKNEGQDQVRSRPVPGRLSPGRVAARWLARRLWRLADWLFWYSVPDSELRGDTALVEANLWYAFYPSPTDTSGPRNFFQEMVYPPVAAEHPRPEVGGD